MSREVSSRCRQLTINPSNDRNELSLAINEVDTTCDVAPDWAFRKRTKNS